MHATFVDGKIQVSRCWIIPWQGLGQSAHVGKAQPGLEFVPMLKAQGAFPHV